MEILKRRSIQWALANLFGIGGYLFFASRLWVAPGDFGNPGGPGDAFAWLFTVLPFLALFALLDLAALITILRRLLHGDRIFALAIWVVILTLWSGAVLLDHRMSYNVISLPSA